MNNNQNPLDRAFDALNRDIRRPNYSQLPVTYGRRFGFEHQVDADPSYCDIYPVTLLIDSQDRNTDKDEPGSYSIDLNETLKNIHSIELTGGKVPNPCYNITSNNNLLCFQETTEQVETDRFYQVRVAPGDYSAAVLANALAKAMGEVGSSKYKVSLDHISKRFTISTDDKVGTGIFNLIFTDRCEYMGDHAFIDDHIVTQDCRGKTLKFDVKTVRVGNQRQIYKNSSIGKILGFKPENLFGQLSYTGPYCYNINPFSYIALFVNDFDRVHSVNPKVDGAFCVLPLDDSTSSFDVDTRDVDNARYIKHFYPPLKELNKITVKFVDHCGNVFDFNGQNNLLIFEIACSFGQPILRNNKMREVPVWNESK